MPLRTHGVGECGLGGGLRQLHLVLVLAGLFVLVVGRVFVAGPVHARRCGRTVIVVFESLSID